MGRDRAGRAEPARRHRVPGRVADLTGQRGGTTCGSRVGAAAGSEAPTHPQHPLSNRSGARLLSRPAFAPSDAEGDRPPSWHLARAERRSGTRGTAPPRHRPFRARRTAAGAEPIQARRYSRRAAAALAVNQPSAGASGFVTVRPVPTKKPSWAIKDFLMARRLRFEANEAADRRSHLAHRCPDVRVLPRVRSAEARYGDVRRLLQWPGFTRLRRSVHRLRIR